VGSLREIKDCRQVRGELPRRWFSADHLDLIVWCDQSGAPVGFQFCYQDRRTERALTWKPESGFQHATVDDGESSRGIYPRTPILNPDGPINFPRLQKLFAQVGAELPADIAEFVSTRLVAPPPTVRRKAN
jgi:hypothetical protein